MVLCARGRSHRAVADAELIRWGDPFARVEAGLSRPDATVEIALARDGPAAGRKRVRVNGVPRRPTALGGTLRVVLFAPEEMLLVVGSPGLRRDAIDRIAGDRSPAHERATATYERALRQRNSLLKSIREGTAGRDQLRYWDEVLTASGGEVIEGRLDALDALTGPLAAAHGEIAPDEGRLALRYAGSAAPRPGEAARDALARRLGETAEKEVWNGSTLVGPHRDDLSFLLGDREMAGTASRGQQRSAILALKLAAARPAGRERRPAAAPPPRRRLQRARPGAPRPPGAADRGAAPGLRHDDDTRRPGPGAAGDREGLARGGGRGRRPRACRPAVRDEPAVARCVGSATSSPRPRGRSGWRRSSGSPGPRPRSPRSSASGSPGRRRRATAPRQPGRAHRRGRPPRRRPGGAAPVRGAPRRVRGDAGRRARRRDPDRRGPP